MPSGITGRDGFLPALVKSIHRSFPCRHPTTGGSLKGSPAGTPLTHRFLYYSYSTTAAAVCHPSFCPGPQPAGRRDGPSEEFARNVGLSNRVGLCVLVGVAVGPPGLAGPYHSGALLLRTSLGKTAILHLCFGTEKNRRLGSKKARYIRAFRRRHLFLSPHYGGAGAFKDEHPSEAPVSLSNAVSISSSGILSMLNGFLLALMMRVKWSSYR